MTKFEAGYFDDVYQGDYDLRNPPGKLAFYQELVERHVPQTEPRRILDLGCAFGRFLASLGAGWERYGIDLSTHAVSAARRFLPGAGLAVADCVAPPFRGRFEAIVAFDVIEHVANLDRVAAAVREALADDGVFVFVVPVYDGPLGPVIRKLDRDPTHVHKQSRAWWLQWAERNFRVVEWTGILRYLIGHYYLHVPHRYLRAFAPAIAVTVRREMS